MSNATTKMMEAAGALLDNLANGVVELRYTGTDGLNPAGTLATVTALREALLGLHCERELAKAMAKKPAGTSRPRATALSMRQDIRRTREAADRAAFQAELAKKGRPCEFCKTAPGKVEVALAYDASGETAFLCQPCCDRELARENGGAS